MLRKLILISLLLTYQFAFSQIKIGGINNSNFSLNYSDPQEFEIGGMKVSGVQFLDENAVLSLTGLKVGDKVNIPGDRVSTAIKKLWGSRNSG